MNWNLSSLEYALHPAPKIDLGELKTLRSFEKSFITPMIKKTSSRPHFQALKRKPKSTH
jgi:hypothetical protein